VLRLGLGATLLASTQIITFFSLFRGTDWLQVNAPGFYVRLPPRLTQTVKTLFAVR
jgi:hypothetical protein